MKPARDKLLVLAAFGPEIAPLSGHAASLGIDTGLVGVGLVAASRGAALAIADKKPAGVVLVGTCGAYDGAGRAIGDVVVGSRIGLASSAAARGEGALLSSLTAWLEPDRALTAALDAHGATPAVVSTTLALTTDDGLARKLRATYACDVEHLEAYAVASACEAAKVPFACVLGVANRVGSSGREEWLLHHEAVEARVAHVVKAWLRG